MSNRPVLSQAICGLRVTGAGITITTIIIGSRACGSLRRESVCFGRQDGGVGEAALMCLAKVTGARMSVFTAALTTATATPETATGADDGVETRSNITPL